MLNKYVLLLYLCGIQVAQVCSSGYTWFIEDIPTLDLVECDDESQSGSGEGTDEDGYCLLVHLDSMEINLEGHGSRSEEFEDEYPIWWAGCSSSLDRGLRNEFACMQSNYCAHAYLDTGPDAADDGLSYCCCSEDECNSKPCELYTDEYLEDDESGFCDSFEQKSVDMKLVMGFSVSGLLLVAACIGCYFYRPSLYSQLLNTKSEETMQTYYGSSSAKYKGGISSRPWLDESYQRA